MVVVVVVVVLLIFHQNTDQNRRGAAGECKKRHPNPPQIGELSAMISQQASPPQAKQILVRQVLVKRRSMKYDLSARTALIHRQKYPS